jgi:hypothetical protein
LNIFPNGFSSTQRIALAYQKIPQIHENKTFFANYTFLNIRKRDKHRKELKAEKDAKNERLEKLSQDPNYKKPRKPNHDAEICYKSDAKPADNDKDDDDDGGGDDDEVEFGKLSTIEESVHPRSKEAGVFFPVDVYDKGERSRVQTDR